MRCLLCGKEMGKGDILDVLIGEDPLCHACRRKWVRSDLKWRIEGLEAYGIYAYEENFSSCLLQYKECFDEALKDVFLFEVKKKLRIKYAGSTLCMMPSSLEKEKQRGFHHLAEMFSSLKLPLLEPFEKVEETDQRGKNAVNRKQMEHMIRLRKDVQLPKNVVLCDDVITTGSTIRGALHAFPYKNHHVRIFCVSFARRIREGKLLFGSNDDII